MAGLGGMRFAGASPARELYHGAEPVFQGNHQPQLCGNFGGETIAIPQGVLNPFYIVGPLVMLALVVYVMDASISLGAQGDRYQPPRRNFQKQLIAELGGAK